MSRDRRLRLIEAADCGLLARRHRPAARLGDLLAGRAERIATWIATRHPDLSAEGAHRSAVDHPLDDRGTGREEVARGWLESLEHDVAHPFVAAVELRIGAFRGKGRAAVAHATRIAQPSARPLDTPVDGMLVDTSVNARLAEP